MSPEQTIPGLFERLFLRWQERYLRRVVWLTLLLTWPIVGLGAFYLWLNAPLSASHIGRAGLVFLVMSLVAMALLSGYAAFTTRTARAVLAGKQAASPQAWQEMATLSRRFVVVCLLANLLVVDLPSLVSILWFRDVGGADLGHWIVAALLVTVNWTVLVALLLDRALTPWQSVLVLPGVNLPEFGLSWKARLHSVLLTSVVSTLVLLGGTAYRGMLEAGAADQAWLVWVGAGGLMVLLTWGGGALLVEALRYPLRVVKQALEQGLDADQAFELSAYGSGELSGLVLGLHALLERIRAVRRGAERKVQASMAEAERRQARLQLINRIGRLALLPQDLEAFLGQAVRMLAGSYHHAAFFWLAEDGRTLTLEAAAMANQPSPLEQMEMVEVDRRSVVGMAVYLGRTFLENDIRQERSLQSKITLPTSEAELAVPIRVGGRVVAALDLQSERAREFHEEDLEALEAVAAQIALVIQNQRLEAEYRGALRQVASLTARSVRQAWESRVRRHRRGYRYTPAGVAPVEKLPGTTEAGQRTNVLDIPIALRGQKIGVISLARRDDLPWSEAERTLAVEIAEQVALALENARLLADAQQRAAQEQLIGELTTRFSRTLEPEVLLQEAVSELKRLPNVSEVSVFIQPPEAGDGSGRQASSRE